MIDIMSKGHSKKVKQRNIEYLNIVDNILHNKEFNKIGNIEHHGINRLDHSMKVSYYSYRISRFMKLDYVDTAKGGLLHDFFLNENKTSKEKFKSYFKHPKIALETAKSEFKLNEKEQNIIKAHMFPISPAIPKYAESWIVTFVDKGVAIGELIRKIYFGIKPRVIKSYNIIFIMLLSIRII